MTVLYIVLGIILFLVGVLTVPFNVYAEYIDEFTMYVRWLFVKIYIYPPAEKKKKKKEKKKKKKKKEEKPKVEDDGEDKIDTKPKKDNFIKTFYNNQGVQGIIDLLKEICTKLKKGFKGMGRSFYIRKFWLRINVAGGDSAETAVKYGKICSAVYPSLSYIFNSVHSKNCSVKINPDFLGKKTQGAFSLHLALIPSKLIGAGILMGIRLGVSLVKVLISNAKSSKQPKTTEKTVVEDTKKDSSEAIASKTQKGGKTQ